MIDSPFEPTEKEPTASVSEVVEAEARPRPIQPILEDLTLGQALSRLFRAPRQIWPRLRETLNALPEDFVSVAPPAPFAESAASENGETMASATEAPSILSVLPSSFEFWRVIFVGAVVALGLVGSILLQNLASRSAESLPLGMVLLLMASVALASLYLTGVVALPNGRAERLAPLEPTAPRKRRELASPFESFMAKYGLRLALLVFAVVGAAGAWSFNGGNQFTTVGVFCWLVSVLCFVGLFADRDTDIGRWFRQRRSELRAFFARPVNLRLNWTVIALLVILAAGAWFIFGRLSDFPPDMTSDHVEMALDANKILSGDRPVFFPNNGGRESFQMYYLAALHQVTGIPISHDLLKIGGGLQGMLMILLAWWMGRAIFGEENRDLGNLAGLSMAALVAVSYWHTMLARLGERIILTPIITTLVIIFLARAMRYNRRADFILCGLSLGVGLYFYQAARMLPVVVIAGYALAVLFRPRSWAMRWAYAWNFVVLVVISAAVFVPLARYWYDFPGSFWERTGGRFFGEETVPILDAQGNPLTDPQGQVMLRAATTEDRLEALRENLPVFFDNLRRTLYMFNIRGDNAWITGDPDGTPQLDAFAGALFIFGVGLLIVRAFRRRDPVDLLLPLAIFILVLPSALSIAFTIEVPSSSRASGSLPLVYLSAGLALAVILQALWQSLGRSLSGFGARRVLVGAAVFGIGLGGLANYNAYFVDAAYNYRESTFPYKQAGEILRGFAESTGAPGNAFMVSWDYWWDWRALGIDAGDPWWPNGIVRDNLIPRIKSFMSFTFGSRWELRPDRQLMFFLHPLDVDSLKALQETFPGGTVIPISTFKPTRDFVLYTAPPVGCDWMNENLGRLPLSCQNPG